MEILSKIWSYFATNILQQPAFMIGFIVLIGYILLQRPWYDILAGTIKAIVGYLILTVGSGGLVNNFRPVLVGLGERFNINATVIDPYFGQNAVTACWCASANIQSFAHCLPQETYRYSRLQLLTG